MNIVKYTSEFSELAKDFKCGNVIIDRFLQSGDALDENQGITYILLSEEKNFIIGYYNIEVGRIDQIETIGDKALYKPMGGTVNINYLAVHNNFQKIKISELNGKKIYIGDYLLRNCEKRILNLRKEVGISFITLYSTEQGYYLYRCRNGYEDFENDMSTFTQESDKKCYKLYKCVDDIIE